jgi:hypothetical protein
MLELYLTWIKEKTAVCSYSDIKKIQQEFKEWYLLKGWTIDDEHKTMVKKYIESHPLSIMKHHLYSKVRHSIAIKVKNSKIYQRKR